MVEVPMDAASDIPIPIKLASECFVLGFPTCGRWHVAIQTVADLWVEGQSPERSSRGSPCDLRQNSRSG